MLAVLSFIFGASIGSFVQVVATRIYVAPIVKGRSKCLTCSHPLTFTDLIPVLSYIALRGKCRYCKVRYGISALVVEVLFGSLFVLVYTSVLVGQPSLLHAFLWLTYYTLLIGVLGAMALYDKAHSYIPHAFINFFLALTTVMYVIRVIDSPSLVTIISPLLVALPFFALWVVTRGKGLGFGDIILFFGIGQFLSLEQGFATLILSVWIGALYGIFYKYVFTKNKKGTTPIPFVPFIVIAFFIVLFGNIDIFSILSVFASVTSFSS